MDTMRHRTRPEIRCPVCYMLQQSCLCHLAPALPARTALTVVHHSAERFKTTSTIRLLQLAVQGCHLQLRAGSHPHQTTTVIKRRPVRIALFPLQDAVDLNEIRNRFSPDDIELVIPDGTWNQASRIARRDPHFKHLTFARLPAVEPSIFVLREQAEKGRTSTFEAAAAALGILEGPELQKAMMAFFREAVYRILESRGLRRPSLRESNL